MTSKNIRVLSLFLFFSLIAFACGQGSSFTEQVAVALTQTAAAFGQPSPTSVLLLSSPVVTIAPTDTFAPSPTATLTPTLSVSYQPMNAVECNNLQVALSQSVGFPGDIQNSAPFTDYVNQWGGTGCKVSFSLTGVAGNSMEQAVTSVLQNEGWQENTSYAAAGPADMQDGYQKADMLCLLESSSAPADASLCPKDSNYYHCLGSLQPYQVVHTVSINCARPEP
jgi:hypothetical protein